MPNSHPLGLDEGGLLLTIADNGPNVPEQDLGNLTRRGWRLDTASPSSGIGLSIVCEIVDVYRIGFARLCCKNSAGKERPRSLLSSGLTL
ncbi:hypothetical protein HGG76_26370 [Ochrobactrum tritici]|uniref:Histidine kinase/HSP90-like ATPase domain-containing protein n=1 Tax=Brucella tritici TaxID=94626 RepID=A0A7X6FSF2_9HYPH|nr:hypothetical protein [Brucella tritici]NKW11165.1 hypothetical protein [Brucella tritici]